MRHLAFKYLHKIYKTCNGKLFHLSLIIISQYGKSSYKAQYEDQLGNDCVLVSSSATCGSGYFHLTQSSHKPRTGRMFKNLKGSLHQQTPSFRKQTVKRACNTPMLDFSPSMLVGINVNLELTLERTLVYSSTIQLIINILVPLLIITYQNALASTLAITLIAKKSLSWKKKYIVKIMWVFETFI